MRELRSASVIAKTVLALAASACSAESRPRADSTPVDADTVFLRVGPPEVRLGDARSDSSVFGRVVGAVCLGDGRVVVADGHGQRIRAFDATGTEVWHAGGRGQGDGEFMGIGGIAVLPPDSLLVHDALRARTSILSPDGRHVRSLTLEPPRPGLSPPAVAGALRGGAIVAVWPVAYPGGEPSPGHQRDSAVVALHDPLGRPSEILGVFPQSESMVEERGGRVWVRGVRMGRELSVAVGGDAIAVATGHAPRVLRFDPTGRALPALSLPLEPVPVTAAVERAYAERTQRGERSGTPGPLPDTLPFIDGLLVDGSGRTWVHAFVPEYSAAQASEWWVFGPDGALHHRVRLGRRVRPVASDSSRVLAIVADTFDVQTVEVLPLERTEAGLGGR